MNTFLDGLDRALWNEGVDLIRFGDDIALPSTGSRQAEDNLAHLRRMAPRWGMELSPSKTKIYNTEDGVPFLGQLLRGGMRKPPAIDTPERVMIYITGIGGVIRAKGERFVVTMPGREPIRYPAARTRQMVCTDRAVITTAALALSAKHGVDLVITDRRNGYLGRFSGGDATSRMRLAQASINDEVALRIAIAIVRGKIINQRIALQRTAARRAAVPAEVVARMNAAIRQAEGARATDTLMGIEGSAGRQYFRGLSCIVPAEWRFAGRNRQPPRDPVNALLSYGYALLLNETRTALEMAGMDPALGFLHRPWRGRPSLALDLMEEFRPLLIDTVVLRAISTRALTLGQFKDEGESGCRIDIAGRRSFIEEFERRMLTSVKHPEARQSMSYRAAIAHQAVLLSRVVMGRAAYYQPMPWR